ncbi:5'-3' exonuclease H3TH domain-containing protein [Conexibacter sp. DBS9H8]|uniref:5'-3' exonuclease n=1 Tax=Conexibacter sp. DBS9H8 TaxID=2937801 RepID=UPI00200F44B4|nr:5'-3' exonuclease H3TH domain-containing protein [Conexibacter sp. DBS9H8]
MNGAAADGPSAGVETPPAVAPLLVVDAPWLLYRSHFGLPSSIIGVEGRPVNALLGMANALLGVVGALKPRAVAVCFGAEDAAHRVRLFSGYHAAREAMPPALAWQFARAPELFAAWGWTVANAGALEADDLLGAYAEVESAAAGDTVILTADRDMYQCVEEHTRVLHLKGGELEFVDVSGVEARYGIAPAQVPDFIALRGDPSDGIPGAPGIGAKTAASLLVRFGSLEALLAAADAGGDDLRPRLAQTLCDHAEALRTFRAVATLVPIHPDRPPDAVLDVAAAAAAADALGLGQLAGRLRAGR